MTAQAATGTVMNVAFRGVGEHAAYKLTYNNSSPRPPSGQGAWFEDDQAAALKAGDITQFGYTVHTADLRRGVNRLQAVGPGLHERVYTSKFSLGQGMSYTGVGGRGNGGTAKGFFAQTFNLLGRYQPYGVYIPRASGRPGYRWSGTAAIKGSSRRSISPTCSSGSGRPWTGSWSCRRLVALTATAPTSPSEICLT